jgi:hypothetical protein
MLVFITILVIISGVFITEAWWHVHPGGFSIFGKRIFSHNTKLSKANTFLYWAMVVSWFGVAAIAGGVFLYVTNYAEIKEGGGGGMATKLLLWGSIGIIIIQGFLAAIGANYIREASKTNLKYYFQSIIAACISLGAAGSLFLYQIIQYIQLKMQAKQAAKNRFNSAILRAEISSMHN